MKISGKYKIPVIEPMGSMADYAYKMHLKFNPIVLTPSQLRGERSQEQLYWLMKNNY